MELKRVIACMVLISALSIFSNTTLFAQDGVLIDYQTTPPARDASAILELRSNDQGLLAPRVALTASNSASPVSSPATSLLVYNTATAGTAPNNVTPGYYYWDGSGWKRLMSSANTPTGSGTLNKVVKWTPTGSQLGDSQIWDNGTNVGIGITPSYKLDVDGMLHASDNSFLGPITPAYPFKSTWTWQSDNTGYYAGVGFQKPDGTAKKLHLWWIDNVVETNINSVLNVATPGHTFDGTAPNTGRIIGAKIASSGDSYFNGGNVGIGTSPAYRLDVVGDINTSTGYRIAGTAGVGTYLRGNGTQFVGSTIPYSDITGTPASLSPSGAAGGDLSGTYPNPQVVDDSHNHTEIKAKPTYAWNAATAPNAFPKALAVSFVQSADGWPSYGSVLHMSTYANDGGTMQLYAPYNTTYGGNALRYRLGLYNDAGWTGWRTIWDENNDGAGSGLDADLLDGQHGSYYNAYANLTGIPTRTNWSGVHRNFVAEQLSWKNYGNNHTIFDASAGTSPTGTAISNTNPDVAWAASYPTLMGWNGTNTYGVRVDRAKYAETAGSAPGDNLGNHIATSGIKRNAHNTGFLEGSYNNIGQNDAQTNPIYTIGSSYNPTATTLSNMYGIGYTHTNATFVSGSPGGWGMYVAEAGTARIWLGAGSNSASYFNAGNVGIGTTAPVAKLEVEGGAANWNEATPGLATGSIHLDPGTSSANIGNAITWGAHDAGAGDNGQAGIYVRSDGSYGTKMYFGTTSSYAAGSKTQMMIDAVGNVGIGTVSPDDKLDVVGNAQISGYLRVGDPGTPNDINTIDLIYDDDFENTNNFAWSSNTACSNNRWFWKTNYDDDEIARAIVYDTQGSRSRGRAQSGYIWIPDNYSSFFITCMIRTVGSGDEDTYDGVFLEYYDGSAWQKVGTFDEGGYTYTVSGSNTSCNGSNSQTAWGFNDHGNDVGQYYQKSNNIALNDRYVRIGFTGFEDISGDDETFWLHSVGLFGNRSSITSFQTGGVYAEGAVFARSNKLLGDLAEYFSVAGPTIPGTVISVNDKRKNAFEVAQGKYSDKVIGVHSSEPSLLLNTPDGGTPVALSGRVLVRVSGEGGKIKAGDFLTLSSEDGVAMKADQACYIIGKALESFGNKEEGTILCFVESGWYNPGMNLSLAGGEFHVVKGDKSVKVYDQRVSEQSRIFVTMLGDPGCRYWLSAKANGHFELSFSEGVGANTAFDYFVENASTDIENAALTSNVSGSRPNISSGAEGMTELTLERDEDAVEPPRPPDPSKPWYYSPAFGFKELGVQGGVDPKQHYAELEKKMARGATGGESGEEEKGN